MKHEDIINTVKNWLDSIVIELNLCPFANRELIKNRIRFETSDATSEEALLASLTTEINILIDQVNIETSILIHPFVLQNFDDYNQFLNLAEELIYEKNLEGVIQIASFHPDYRFAGTAEGDAENYSNKSPYPMLHLLRESSLELAIDAYPDIDAIPQNNIEKLNQLGSQVMEKRLRSCFDAKSQSPLKI